MFPRKPHQLSLVACALLAAASLLLCSAGPLSTGAATLTQAWLVKDIAEPPGVGSDPSYPGLLNGLLFFSADDTLSDTPGWHRYDMWQAGSAAGSAQKVVNQAGMVIRSQINPVFVGKDYVLFSGNATGCSESGLYRADSSGGAAVKIWDTTGQINTPTSYTALGDFVLFFTDKLDMNTQERFTQVWRTNGQPGGAQLLARLPNNSMIMSDDADVWHGAAYFAVYLSEYQAELWRSDGTPAGTRAVAHLPGGFGWVKPLATTPQLLFFYLRTVNGIQLWQSDGTQMGTRQVMTVGQDSDYIDYYFKDELTSISDTLLFMAVSPAGDYQLLKTRGRASGVEEVYNFGRVDYPEVGNSFVTLGDRVYFCAGKGQQGIHLWRTDGTTANTAPVLPGAYGYTGCRNLKALQARLFFAASTPDTGEELWTSQGSPENTLLLADVNPGPGSSAPNPLAFDRMHLWLVANVPEYGAELWALNYPTHSLFIPAVLHTHPQP